MASASPSPSPTTSSFPSSGNESSEASDDAAPLKGDGPKRERERTHHMNAPRPSSPVAATLEQTAAREAQEREPSEDEEPELADNDGKRPVSPVAKALLSQTSSLALENEGASDAKPRSGGDDGKQGSAIPNLLSSGQFPPAPHSPRHHFSPLASGSPGLASPQMPAAPPSTPYTPYAATGASAGGASVPTLHPPLPLSGGLSALPIRASSPPLLNNVPPSPLASPSATRPSVTAGDVRPPNVPPVSPGGTAPTTTLDPHYHALLNQALHETEEREKARAASLTAHERQNYTTIEEYQHALSRERRHSTSLAMELTHFQFLARYASCNVHSAAEINEEARINSLIKGIDAMKKGMDKDRCRVVMELEREEERMINTLVVRLEEVEREKRLLERQISSVRGGGGLTAAGMMGGEEGRLHARLERMRVPSLAAGPSQHQQIAAASQTRAVGVATAEGGEKRGEANTTMEEGSEEEEEEGENEDILEGRYHDPEVEKELADLLKMKESK